MSLLLFIVWNLLLALLRYGCLVACQDEQELRPVLAPCRAIICVALAIEAQQRIVGQQLDHRVVHGPVDGCTCRMLEGELDNDVTLVGIGVETAQMHIAGHARSKVVEAAFDVLRKQALVIGSQYIYFGSRQPAAGTLGIDVLQDLVEIDCDVDVFLSHNVELDLSVGYT